MSYYMKYSTKIYNIYLRYVAPEDIHVYSIDEVFMDVTSYLRTYGMNAHDLAMQMIRDVLIYKKGYQKKLYEREFIGHLKETIREMM